VRRAKTGTHHQEQTADCQQIPPRRSLTSHQPPAFPFASSRLRVSPTAPKGLPCVRCVAGGTGGGVPGTQHPESPPTSHAGFSHAQKFAIPHAKSRSAKWGTHHCEPRSGGHSTESGGHTTENGDTPSRSRLQTASKSHHAGHSPCIGRLRFRSRLRGFAASRLRVSPTVPKGLPCTHCVAGGTGGGTGDTAPEIPPRPATLASPMLRNSQFLTRSREDAK
jgi:hypothetical protein